MNFYSALEKLKNRESKKIANNTYLLRIDDGTIGVKLHKTIIIKFLASGVTILNSGGWKTITTKSRMNDLIEGYRIYQKKHEWFVHKLGEPWGVEDAKYFDGMDLK